MKIPSPLIVIGIVVAMVGGGTTMLTYMGVQEALAAQNCEGFLESPDTCYCYTNTFVVKTCFSNKGECNKAQMSDQTAASGCFRQK